MAEEHRLISESWEEDVQAPIGPHAAAEVVQEVHDATVILPRKRSRDLARAAVFGAVVLVPLAVFGYWNFLRTSQMKRSSVNWTTRLFTSRGRSRTCR